MSGRELPAGWTTASISDLAADRPNSLAIGPFGSNLVVKDYRASGVPLVFVRDIRSERFGGPETKFVSFEKANELASHAVSSGDLLITKMGDPPGDTSVYPDNRPSAIITADCIKLNPDPKLTSSTFLKWALRSREAQEQILDRSTGVAQQKMSLERFRTLELDIPPLPEQHRIVEKIEALTARSRRAREALDALPALIDRYRQSILATAFRGELTADWRQRGDSLIADSVEDRPDSLPAEWGWQRLDAVAAVTGGLTKNKDRERLPRRRPYLRVANVYADELRLDDIQEIGVAPQELARVLLQSGDLLIVEGNGSLDQIGRVAIWDAQVPECVHQNHIIKVRFPERRFAEFALLWLLSPLGRKHIEREASSTAGLHTLSLSKVSRLPIPVPTIDEAEAIVARVRAALQNLSRFAKPVADAHSRLSTLDQSILAKAFRGELVPQDPDDEPASVLLERIRAERAAAGVTPRRGRRARVE